MTRRHELAQTLHTVPLFARCTPRELRAVARFVETAALPAGTHLVREGEEGDALFVILAGEAEVRSADRTLARVAAGDYFGELALLDGEPRAADVIATTDVQVGVLGIRMFRTLVRELPDLSEQLLAGLAGELRAARARADGREDPQT
ncbi:MAG: cyclic nucleotide-binding domain-containing protein [Actinomycetota bacterium]